MIASERSLASAHQPQAPQRRQPKGSNGTIKPAVRPVKVYVLDPKTLQQRLEAYVGQKKKKVADEENKRQREREDETKLATTTISVLPPTTIASAITAPAKPVTSVVTSKPTLSKQFPPIAPKLSNNQDAAAVGNGVTIQCLSTSGFSLPTGPIVMTNGVTLLQTPISQASIQASGIFLSGITQIPTPSVPVVNAQPKSKSPPKRKSKKRKTTKKRKLTNVDKEKEDYDESELAYLRKETTTRLGRVSRPVSRPRSPIHSIAANLEGHSPIKRKKAAQTNAEGAEFRCKSCLQVCASQEKLNLHTPECPQIKIINVQVPSHSLTSTNKQGKIPELVPILHPQLEIPTNPVETSTSAAPPVSTVVNSTPCVSTISEVHINSSQSVANSFHFHAANTRQVSQPTRKTHPVEPSETASPLSLKLSQSTEYFSDFNSNRNCSKVLTSTEANINVSLVPTTEEPKELLHRTTANSNVDLVPSSYSIPSSPPSLCHSPGFPDNNIHLLNSIAKEGTNSPQRVCRSPVDPMLLRSRSPFLPPILETSSASIGASNLSIPEESLCRGELFMDLGESILETSGVGRMSPFCETVSERLFSNSPMKPPSQIMDEASVPDVDLNVEPDTENIPTSTPSHVVAPILTTEDANDGEIFQSANYARSFVHPSAVSHSSSISALHSSGSQDKPISNAVTSSYSDFPKTPLSNFMESDVSMDSSEITDQVAHSASPQKKRSVWQFVKEQINSCGISQACGEISEMAEKLSRIARDQFIPIREEEIERLGNTSPIIQVDTPFFSHLLDLPFGSYIFKEDAGRKKRLPPPPPFTSSDLSFTGGVEDVEKFLPSNMDLIALPHLTNLDLS